MHVHVGLVRLTSINILVMECWRTSTSVNVNRSQNDSRMEEKQYALCDLANSESTEFFAPISLFVFIYNSFIIIQTLEIDEYCIPVHLDAKDNLQT